jgi:hypothetical protein
MHLRRLVSGLLDEQAIKAASDMIEEMDCEKAGASRIKRL